MVIPRAKHEYLKSEIDKFVMLDRNWDGYGAMALFPAIGATASQLLMMLGAAFVDKITDMFPNPHGTITFEWENRACEKLGLEIGADNYSYFIRYNVGQPLLVNGEDILFDFKDFAQNLEAFLSGEIQEHVL
jgi:hypothetical protein